jgi:hypothetical protein
VNYKEQLNELSKLINTLREDVTNELTNINAKLVSAVAQIPAYELSDSTLVMSKLKYEEIKFNDTGTWVNIASRPELVLHRWVRRLWLLAQNEYGYDRKEEIEGKYGVGGRKSLQNFFFYIDYYINSIFVNPSLESKYRNELIGSYDKGTIASKKLFEDFFKILQEELLKYEESDNK